MRNDSHPPSQDRVKLESVASLQKSWSRFGASVRGTLPLLLLFVVLFHFLGSNRSSVGMTDLVTLGIGIVGIGAMLVIAEGDLAGLFPLVAARGRYGAVTIGRTVSFWFHTRKRLAIVDGKLAIATTGGPSSDSTNAGRNSWKWTLSSGGHKVSFMAPFGVTDDLREQIAAWAVRRGVTVDFMNA